MFEKAIEFTLKQEGVYSNDSEDSGKQTKFGISKAAYPSLDIENITLEEAKHIYKRDYWDVSNLDKVNDFKLALAIFDFSVNSGVYGASKKIQELLGIRADGIIGKVSIKHINEANNIFYDYMKVRIRYYIDICKHNPTQLKFMGGWLNRVVELIKYVN